MGAGLFPGGEVAADRYGMDHSTLSNSDVKNEYICVCTPLVGRCDVDRNNLFFYVVCFDLE